MLAQTNLSLNRNKQISNTSKKNTLNLNTVHIVAIWFAKIDNLMYLPTVQAAAKLDSYH